VKPPLGSPVADNRQIVAGNERRSLAAVGRTSAQQKKASEAEAPGLGNLGVLDAREHDLREPDRTAFAIPANWPPKNGSSASHAAAAPESSSAVECDQEARKPTVPLKER